MYTFKGFFIPEHMMEGIQLYVENGKPPGAFLQAVLQNDLKEAVERADVINLRNIPAFVSYFYNEAPAECWGSKEAVEQWIGQGGLTFYSKKEEEDGSEQDS